MEPLLFFFQIFFQHSISPFPPPFYAVREHIKALTPPLFLCTQCKKKKPKTDLWMLKIEGGKESEVSGVWVWRQPHFLFSFSCTTHGLPENCIRLLSHLSLPPRHLSFISEKLGDSNFFISHPKEKERGTAVRIISREVGERIIALDRPVTHPACNSKVLSSPEMYFPQTVCCLHVTLFHHFPHRGRKRNKKGLSFLINSSRSLPWPPRLPLHSEKQRDIFPEFYSYSYKKTLEKKVGYRSELERGDLQRRAVPTETDSTDMGEPTASPKRQ